MTEKEYWSAFRALGYSEIATAGIMGNIQHESGFHADRVQGDIPYSNKSVEYTRKVDTGELSKSAFIYHGPGGGGYGACQWTHPDRKEALYNFWKEFGSASIGDPEMQIAFFNHEVNKKHIREKLLNAQTVREASFIMLRDFERPRGWDTEEVQSKRYETSLSIYNRYKGAFVAVKEETTMATKPMIRKGSTGSYVKQAQQLLIKKGYSCGAAGADGDFGAGTYNAVIKFQRANGLEADGIVGPATWAALEAGAASVSPAPDANTKNSPLVVHTRISPNKDAPRNHAIDRVTVHCVVGQVTAESLGGIFANPSKYASSNYGVDKNGRVGMYVEEKDCSWCSSNRDNDNRAITIETASDATYPYAVTDAAYNGLLDLLTDICKRHGKKKLLWFGDKAKTLAYQPKSDEMVMTVHRWFAQKSCPGQYLYERHPAIAAEVTRRLGGTTTQTAASTATVSKTRPLIKRGSKGAYVKEAQTMLIKLGYSCGAAGADGDFGSGTYNATVKFQRANGLTADGEIGNATWAALDAAVAKIGKPTENTKKQETPATQPVKKPETVKEPVTTGKKVFTRESAINYMLNIALAEEGYLEKASNYDLDSKTGNAGYNNWNKYARDIDQKWPTFYNGRKNGYAWCFTRGTLILTDRGYKPIEEIEVGDRVLNAYGDGFNAVTNVSNHPADVIDVKAYGAFPFSVTPDHPFLAQERVDKWHRSHGLKNWGFHLIGDLQKGDMLTIPKAPVLYEDSLTYDELWTIGYYVGDGCRNKQNYILCANEKKAVELEAHADVIKGADYPSRTCLEYRLNRKEHPALCEAMDACGRGAVNKRVPECILFGTNEAKRAFLDGYFAADGSVRNGNTLFNTVSKELAAGVAKILFDIGYGCSQNEQHRPPQGKIWDDRYNAYRTFNQREIIYNCMVNKHTDPMHMQYIGEDKYSFVPIKKMSQEPHNELVYTLTVNGDHTYTANNLSVHNCDCFADWCFLQAFGYQAALKLLYAPERSAGAGCQYSADYYRKHGAFYRSNPQVGDQIFFGNYGSEGHIGIVRAVDDRYVYTIEGNTSGGSGLDANGGGVFKKSYALNSSYISGYGRPNWNVVVGAEIPDGTTPVVVQTTTTTTSRPTIQRGSTGAYVREAQTFLIAKGYSCGAAGADGDFGAGTYNAVVAFQRANGLTADGIVGPATWKALIGA